MRPSPRQLGASSPAPRRRSPGAALLAALALTGLAACGTTAPLSGPGPEGPAPTPPPEAGPPLTIRVVDVGQGDGMIILSPTGKAIVVDAGDRGRDAPMAAQLTEDGVTSVDLAVMTHPHADHIGGMQKTLERFPAKIFLDPGFDYGSGIYTRLLEHLEAAGTKIVIARRGRTIDIGGGAKLRILAPDEPLLGGTRSDANSNSVILRLEYGTTSMLLTGDAEAPTERRLLADPDTIAADILKVAHHGSEHSTLDAFLTAVHPSLAVISCGLHNKFGHPAPPTLDRLERAGIDVLRTDLNGTITLVSDGTRWSVQVAEGDTSALRIASGEPLRPRPPPGRSRPRPEDLADDARGDTASEGSPTATGGTAPPVDAGTEGKRDINTATAAELREVEGVGPAKATAIVVYREEHGPFQTIHELTRVQGIGAKTAARIAERFAVFPAPDEAPYEEMR
ncbi:MAG: MBL fold metallo-hydrolase [Deltaproteobacteria bacterium]|nr:MAG: MBL fold metallo-hydrolase [Deltaproteobacteria bacterium]